jgi:hypothetical protein
VPFKARAPSCTVIAHYALNGQMRSKAHSALTAPLVLPHRRVYKCAVKKILFNGQMRNKHFLIVIYHSLLVKGAMNAVRLCKLQWPKVDQVRNEYSPQLSKLMA